mmetsp:Transcript_45003/g.137448  ORF Transcript_45003/g.137448 Transcript_45003/m.137448 type:complete len:404 (-) Transcript_45003:206-1417(-)
MLNDGNDRQEKIILDRLAVLSLLYRREGIAHPAETRIWPDLQRLLGHHLHALTADLKRLKGDVPVVADGHLDGHEGCRFHATRGFQLQFRCHDHLSRTQLEPLFAGRMSEDPTDPTQAKHGRQIFDRLLVVVVQHAESLGGVRIGLLGWFVDRLHDDLLILGWLRRPIVHLLGFVLFVHLLVDEPSVQESESIPLKVESPQISLKVVRAVGVQADSALPHPALLLTLNLEGELIVHVHELLQRPAHFHVAEGEHALSPSSIDGRSLPPLGVHELDGAVLPDDAFHVGRRFGPSLVFLFARTLGLPFLSALSSFLLRRSIRRRTGIDTTVHHGSVSQSLLRQRPIRIEMTFARRIGAHRRLVFDVRSSPCDPVQYRLDIGGGFVEVIDPPETDVRADADEHGWF